jgi:Putative gypsy type transposon
MASLPRPRRFQTERELETVRRMLGLTSAAEAGQVRVGSLPLNLGPGEFVLFVGHVLAGAALPFSPFFLLLLETYGLQLQHLTPHSIAQVAIFVHLCEMFVGVRPCVSLFRHFFNLVKTGKSKDEIGGYYFQTSPAPPTPYIAGSGSGKWEDWRLDWVVATTEPHARLALPTSAPLLDRKEWRTREKLPEGFKPILERIAVLAKDGLTSTHVLGDFLKRRIAPLQHRRLGAWTYTGPNDCGRVQRGENADLSQDHLEILVQGITGEPFVGEHLILPNGIVPLCEDPDLRMVALTTLPMLDDMGLAARQLRGDPNRGVRISEAEAAPSGQEEQHTRRRLRRQDGSYVREPASKRQRAQGDPGQGSSQPCPPGGSPGPAGPASPVRQEERAEQQQGPSPPPPQQQQKRPFGLGARWGVRTPRYVYPLASPVLLLLLQRLSCFSFFFPGPLARPVHRPTSPPARHLLCRGEVRSPRRQLHPQPRLQQALRRARARRSRSRLLPLQRVSPPKRSRPQLLPLRQVLWPRRSLKSRSAWMRLLRLLRAARRWKRSERGHACRVRHTSTQSPFPKRCDDSAK